MSHAPPAPDSELTLYTGAPPERDTIGTLRRISSPRNIPIIFPVMLQPLPCPQKTFLARGCSCVITSFITRYEPASVSRLPILVQGQVRSSKPFTRRGQMVARAGHDTPLLLREVFDRRSGTEHLHAWDGAVQNDPADQREDVRWQRPRHMEHLACDAYARLLHDAALREHFRTDATIAAFWKLPDDQTRLT